MTPLRMTLRAAHASTKHRALPKPLATSCRRDRGAATRADVCDEPARRQDGAFVGCESQRQLDALPVVDLCRYGLVAIGDGCGQAGNPPALPRPCLLVLTVAEDQR